MNKVKSRIRALIEEYQGEDDLGIYGLSAREESLDEDEIADWEEGFMNGWDEAF